MRRYKCEIIVNEEDGHCELFLGKVRPLNFIEKLWSKKTYEFAHEYMHPGITYTFPDQRIICESSLFKKLTGTRGGSILKPIVYQEGEVSTCFA